MTVATPEMPVLVDARVRRGTAGGPGGWAISAVMFISAGAWGIAPSTPFPGPWC